MLLRPAEAGTDSLPPRSESKGSLARGLGPVMKPAERSKVGLSMVITRHDVVHVCGEFLAALAVLVAVGAAVSVSSQDAKSDLRPIRRQALTPV